MGPTYESVEANSCKYILRWSTDLACRPNTHVQCSVRTEGQDGGDLQYDFTRLMRTNDNWKVSSLLYCALYIYILCF